MNNTLIEVDIRIQKLRDVIANGKASLDSFTELDILIAKRMALVESMARERERGHLDKPKPDGEIGV